VPLSLHEPHTWPQLLSATQVAALLLVDRQTVVAMIERGELAGSKIGKQWRIAPEDVWPLIPAGVRAAGRPDRGVATTEISASGRAHVCQALLARSHHWNARYVDYMNRLGAG
jgi:excisionase family DNA binding protein